MNILYRLQNYAADHIRWVQYPNDNKLHRKSSSSSQQTKLSGLDKLILLTFALIVGGVGLFIVAVASIVFYAVLGWFGLVIVAAIAWFTLSLSV